MGNEYIYWIAIAHLPKWTQERINKLVIDIIHNKKISLINFFEYNNNILKNDFLLSDKEIEDINNSKQLLPNIAFQTEKLLNEGYKIIPINSSLYPKTMKDNLKVKYAPTIIYTKGNIKILQEDSIAIVGSRDANEDALKFADNIAKNMAQNDKVVVSGYARGIDRQALDSTVKYNGNSIIVLPQGILTFSNGIKKYYDKINNGNILVLSTFPPNAGWSVGLAMARNRYIYGLAKEIYVAQTNSSGGTWSGAIDGLKKGRNVYVYIQQYNEKSAAAKLVKLGAQPIDFSGNTIKLKATKTFNQLKLF